MRPWRRKKPSGTPAPVDPGPVDPVVAQGRVLVTGQMRSGTTMLASFLNSQDDIHLVPDCLRVPAAALGAFRPPIGPSEPLDADGQRRLWASLQHVALNNPATPQVEREVIEAYQSRDEAPAFSTQAELYLRLLGDIAERIPGHRYYGTKATRGEALAVSVAALGAKAIIILRDPRAVYTSQQARMKQVGEGGLPASELERFVEEWRASYAVWHASGDDVLAFRYEDFVTGDGEFTRIAEYLDVDIKPDAKILSVNTPFGDEFTGARRQAPVNRWREVGDPQAFEFIESKLGPEMEATGYV